MPPYCALRLMLPKLTQQFDLTPEDFTRHAVWISVHNYDSDEAWYDDADEETFRPWMGVLPFGEHRGMALAKAIFKLADGTVHPGYFTTESSQWDNVRLSGTRRRPPPADILHRQCPTIFVNNGAFDFQLREPHLRDAAISNFFSAIGKKPGEVFPVRFATDGELTTGPSSGTIESFYEYDEVRSALEFAAVSGLWGAATRNVSPSATAAVPVVSQGPTVIDPDLVIDLAKADFERFPVWLKVRHADTVRPWYAQFGFVPWRGTIPVESGLCDARIAASFFLSDGSLLFGCVKPIQEIWEEIVCPSTVLPGGAIIPGITPRVRYGGSPMAIVEQLAPCVIIEGQLHSFWCGVDDPNECSKRLYDSLKKKANKIFPIRFEGVRGFATGIVSGEVQGFYMPDWTTGSAPRVFR